MLNLFCSLGITAAITAIIAAFPLSTRRSFFAVLVIASSLGTLIGFCMSVINDASRSEAWLTTIICALFAFTTIFEIGWRWGRKIKKRKEMAPVVVTFLRKHFAEIARENALGNPTITEALLGAVLYNYIGTDLTTLLYIKKHFREIGHPTSLPRVDSGNTDERAVTDDYHYEISRDDFERYPHRLTIEYPGW